MTPTMGIPCVSFVPLGILYENRYFISDECLTCLTEINARINCEDPITRPLRRTLIFFDVLHKDLFPILIHIKKNPRIFRSTIKLLVWMTIPVSCLISAQQEKSRQSSSANINFMKNEFTQFLYNAKETFLYLKITRIVLEHLNSLTLNQPLISKDDCELVSYLLLLIRNILHAPERPTSKNTDYDGDCGNTSDYPQQRQLLGVLFAQGFGQILIHLLSCSQKVILFDKNL
uniref:Timeless N-terminal domain-containing protein n=1 Tax=Daphnia galeata TaxID=27404 RepID=A0A8J2REU5_9CRUS|nr:unnamed protein product [Daphnia galeata]